MASIGIIPGNFSPFHKGHFSIIQQAAFNNDYAVVFVSMKGRDNVSASDMAKIWDSQLTHIMPKNTRVAFLDGESPVRRIYGILGNAEKNLGGEKYTIYSDSQDIAKNFDDKKITIHFPNLSKNNKLEFVPVERDGNFNISGTNMRNFLEDGNKIKFQDNLPDGVDKEFIWKLLRKSVETNILKSIR